MADGDFGMAFLKNALAPEGRVEVARQLRCRVQAEEFKIQSVGVAQGQAVGGLVDGEGDGASIVREAPASASTARGEDDGRREEGRLALNEGDDGLGGDANLGRWAVGAAGGRIARAGPLCAQALRAGGPLLVALDAPLPARRELSGRGGTWPRKRTCSLHSPSSPLGCFDGPVSRGPGRGPLLLAGSRQTTRRDCGRAQPTWRARVGSWAPPLDDSATAERLGVWSAFILASRVVLRRTRRREARVSAGRACAMGEQVPLHAAEAGGYLGWVGAPRGMKEQEKHVVLLSVRLPQFNGSHLITAAANPSSLPVCPPAMRRLQSTTRASRAVSERGRARRLRDAGKAGKRCRRGRWSRARGVALSADNPSCCPKGGSSRLPLAFGGPWSSNASCGAAALPDWPVTLTGNVSERGPGCATPGRMGLA